MRVLVVTVVHHPQDARIYFREIAALLDFGHQVSYAAPFESFAVKNMDPRLETIAIPHATGKRRLAALMAVRKLLRTRSVDFDLVLLHDPELLLAANASQSPVVWDVHEDTAAAISAKAWIPALFKTPLIWLINKLEENAESKYNLLLAEQEYQSRFQKSHPVIPNTTWVPEYTQVEPTNSVIYLGNITKLRGGETLLAIGKELVKNGISLELIGGCPEPELASRLTIAAQSGEVIWHGFVPNEIAKTKLTGKLAGLSLLQDHPNYQVSQPTKIYEYLAAGIPVITTPLAHAKELVTTANAGVVVNFGNVQEVVQQILKLKADQSLWQRYSKSGHSYVEKNHNWKVDREKFILVLEGFAAK